MIFKEHLAKMAYNVVDTEESECYIIELLKSLNMKKGI